MMESNCGHLLDIVRSIKCVNLRTALSFKQTTLTRKHSKYKQKYISL